MSRRFILITMLASALAANAQSLEPTPADALGPFYPDVLPADQDADLARIAGRERAAMGQALELRGRVLDTAGRPMPGIRLELWQADGGGHYLHSGEPMPERRDPNFQGFGVAISDTLGGYRFRTVEPGVYGGRPAHLHLRLLEGGREVLVTQVYFPGRSAEAGLPGQSTERRAYRQVLRYVESAGPMKGANFDFVLPPR